MNELKQIAESCQNKLDDRLKKAQECKDQIKFIETHIKKNGIDSFFRMNLSANSYLFWNSEKKRIYYDDTDMCRPAIETPLRIRLMIKPYLATFFKDLINQL